MKRLFFLISALLCTVLSFGQSKKECIAIRDRIVSEYVLKTNFDSLRSALQAQYEKEFRSMMLKVLEYSETNYKYEYIESGDSLRFFKRDIVEKARKVLVTGFRKNPEVSKLRPSLNVTIHYDSLEAKYLYKEHPEIKQIDRILADKKQNTTYYAIRSLWIEKANFTIDILQVLEQYNARERKELLDICRHNKIAEENNARKAAQERARKEKEYRQQQLKRAQQRANDLSWVKGTWISVTNMHSVMSGGPQQYQLDITGSTVTIQALVNNSWRIVCRNVGFRVIDDYLVLDNHERIQIDVMNGALLYNNRSFYKPR